MGGFCFIVGEVLAAFLWDNGSFVNRPCDGTDCVNRIPEHDCDELDLVPSLLRSK